MAKLLVVDDEVHIRMLYREEFQDEGYEVVEAADGHNLIDRIRQEAPDLIILDIKMAEHNGLDLLQDIRCYFSELPVILSSAYGAFKGDYKALSADSYVIKSSDLTELKRRVKRALESSVPKSEDD